MAAELASMAAAMARGSRWARTRNATNIETP